MLAFPTDRWLLCDNHHDKYIERILSWENFCKPGQQGSAGKWGNENKLSNWLFCKLAALRWVLVFFGRVHKISICAGEYQYVNGVWLEVSIVWLVYRPQNWNPWNYKSNLFVSGVVVFCTSQHFIPAVSILGSANYSKYLMLGIVNFPCWRNIKM